MPMALKKQCPEGIDFDRSNAYNARVYGVSEHTVARWRAEASLPPSTYKSGYAAHAKWERVDWRKQRKVIAREMGVSLCAVYRQAKRLGAPPAYDYPPILSDTDFKRLINSLIVTNPRTRQKCISQLRARKLSSEHKRAITHVLVNHRKPILTVFAEAMTTKPFDDGWLNQMGYLYRFTNTEGYTFRSCEPHRHESRDA